MGYIYNILTICNAHVELYCPKIGRLEEEEEKKKKQAVPRAAVAYSRQQEIIEEDSIQPSETI